MQSTSSDGCAARDPRLRGTLHSRHRAAAAVRGRGSARVRGSQATHPSWAETADVLSAARRILHCTRAAVVGAQPEPNGSREFA